MDNFTLKVIGIVKDTPNVISIRFKKPTFKKFHYKPGQYLTISVKIDGRKYMRPYSISSSPNIDEEIEITIKRFDGGIVSNYLYNKTIIGDLIEVIGPIGDFYYDPSNHTDETPIILWASGSGITPLFSILKTALKFPPQKLVYLFYCSKNKEETIFYNELNTLKQLYEQNFLIYYFYSKEENTNNSPQIFGRISKDLILSILPSLKDYQNSINYICGAITLKEIIKNTLLELGIKSDKIHSEDFELNINPIEFEGINNQVVEINKDNTTYKFEVSKGKSILDAALDNLIDLSYSCQTGNCKLCKAQLINGEIKLIGIEKSSDDLSQNEYLLCCSYPLSDNVTLTIN